MARPVGFEPTTTSLEVILFHDFIKFHIDTKQHINNDLSENITRTTLNRLQTIAFSHLIT